MTTNLTQLYANGKSPKIIGREKELSRLYITLLRNEKPNALLIGEPGVGKTSLIHQLAYDIANKKCVSTLHGFQVVEVNTNALLAGPGYRGVTEAKFEGLINDSLSNGKTILFVDEFHTLEHLGEMSNGQTPGLGNTLKPYLTRPDFRMIGATTSDEFSTINDKALLRRFFKIKVSEPNEEAVLQIIEICFTKYLPKTIKVEGSCVKQIYGLSQSLDGYNPDKAKDIVDITCAVAKLENISIINEDFVSKVFHEFFQNTEIPKPIDEEESAILK